MDFLKRGIKMTCIVNANPSMVLLCLILYPYENSLILLESKWLVSNGLEYPRAIGYF